MVGQKGWNVILVWVNLLMWVYVQEISDFVSAQAARTGSVYLFGCLKPQFINEPY